MDALVLVEYIISLQYKDVRDKIQENSQLLLTVTNIFPFYLTQPLSHNTFFVFIKKILIPSIVWKIGKP